MTGSPNAHLGHSARVLPHSKWRDKRTSHRYEVLEVHEPVGTAPQMVTIRDYDAPGKSEDKLVVQTFLRDYCAGGWAP